jgi:mannose-6-phosphate isomerase-like protein (cupin superfamily)
MVCSNGFLLLLTMERLMNRKQFLNVVGLGAAATAIGGLVGCRGETADGAALPAAAAGNDGLAASQRALYVPNGRNRFEEELMIWGVIPLQIKVSSSDTAGRFFVFEHADMGNGGPPRHFHYEQDEWFYATKGEFAFEVGDERFTLRPGDSLFAPRMVPHAWAHVGDEPGTLLLAVQPAGSLEAFFMENSAMDRPPTPEEAERSFAAHGMKVVGPPLGAD